MSINFPAIDLIGEEPIMAIHTPWGIYRDKGGPLALDSVSGLDAILTVGGSGATTSISVTVQDPEGIAKNILDTLDIHFKWCEVWQEFEGSGDTVKLFEGQINAPITWDSASKKVSWNIVSQVEGEEIGFSVEDKEIITGDTVASDERGRAPSDLIGKAWPLCFGSVIQSPTLKFTWVEDGEGPTQNEEDERGKSDVALIENINGKDRWLPLDIPSIEEYIKAIRACGTMKLGDRALLAQISPPRKGDPVLKNWAHVEAYSKVTGVYETTPSTVVSNAKAWDTLSKLQIEFETLRQGNLVLKQELFEVAFEENKLIDDFKKLSSAEKKGLAGNNILTTQDYIDSKLPRTSDKIIDDLVSTAWNITTKCRLKKGHGLTNPSGLSSNTIHVNINGQKFDAKITGSSGDLEFYKPNELQLIEPLPVCESITFNETKTPYSTTVKITKNTQLKGMYIKINGVGKYSGETVTSVCYVTNQEVVTTQKPLDWDDEVDGAFQPVYLYSWVTYQPILFFVSSNEVTLNRIKKLKGKADELVETTIREYYGEADIFASGTIEESAFLVLPRWFKERPPTDVVILDIDTWALEWDNILSKKPFFGLNVLKYVSTYGRLPKANFSIKIGDSVAPWDGCPKALEDGEDEESNDETDDGKPYTYITNLIAGSTIHAVYGKRTVAGRRVPVVTQLPARYYNWGDDTILGQSCTVVKINKQLSTYEGEGWEDDIWVTQTSPVGPNTADIIEWLVGQYGGDLYVNSASFAATKTLLDPFPSHFGLFSRPQLLSVIKDIAFQARCAVWLKGREVFIKYLPKKPTGNNEIGTNIIEEGTFQITTTATNDLVTVFKAEWHPTYLDLDTNGDQINRYFIQKRNVTEYGLHEHEQHIFIYNQEALVRKCVEFWIIRWSTIWKKVSFNTHITGLSSETLDGVDLVLPAGLLGPTDITVVADKILYDSNNLSADFDLWTPIRLGENTEYEFAWLQ